MVRAERKSLGIQTTYRLVDTCAAEFEAFTPYYYSSYGDENEIIPSTRRKILILGGGPNRIGQGIEFDYCCVHASFALREIGFETVMVNSNPETVSTDYDTSDRLYFEPLTLEDVLEIYQQEKCEGVIVQFGGQTPLNLATVLKQHGVNIIGTSPESIDIAEDRQLFAAILRQLDLLQPANRTALTEEEAIRSAHEVGFPVLLRPSFVLGGRGMFIVYSETELRAVVRQAFDAMPGKSVLVNKFLEDAIELDVDCLSDGETTVIGGMLEHIEFAGVHSGDAAMVLPPHTLSDAMLTTVREATHALAKALNVIGLMNVQFAIKDGDLYVLEVNPRASRTVPFVAKAIGVPLAKLAAKVMTGLKLKDLGFTRERSPRHWCVKEAVFPFVRFPGATITLGPEMRSTGEVMGLDDDLGIAFAKTQATVNALPLSGNVFLSVKDADKSQAVDLGRQLEALGFTIYSTSGTARSSEGERHQRAAAFQDRRRAAHGDRSDQERAAPDDLQHAFRHDPAQGREHDPVGRLCPWHLPHDDDHRRVRRAQRHQGAEAEAGRRAPAPELHGQRRGQRLNCSLSSAMRAHLPIVGSVRRAWWHGHPARGRAPSHMGKTQPSPEASSFAKASAVAQAMADRTEDEMAGRSPMPLAPPSIGRCAPAMNAGDFQVASRGFLW